jgi:HSP20 family protein
MNNTLVKPNSNYVNVFKPFSSIFDDFFNYSRKSSLISEPMDLYEDNDNVYAEIDVPSYDVNDISIEIDGRRVTISGRREENKSDKRYKIKERNSSSFIRTFILEDIIDESKVLAEINNGVLVVTIPKNKKPEIKRIEIKKK